MAKILKRTGKIKKFGVKPKEASCSSSCHSRNKGKYKGAY